MSTDIYDAADFGNVVRTYRKLRGYTQQELADYSGCSIMYISNLERGKETAELGIALRVLATLSLDLKVYDRREIPLSSDGVWCD